MPITSPPANPVPPGYQPPDTESHPVQTGESIQSIAADHGLTWQQLSDLNWKTHDPAEINWYLYHNVGCRASNDTYNYSFRTSDVPGIIWVPVAAGPRPGGGTPGVPGGGGPTPTPGTGTETPAEPGRIARNNVNILALPVVRLPVGWMIPQPTELTRFRIWVPTDSGGVLTIKQGGSGTVDLRRPLRNVIVAPANEVKYEVKTGEFGEFFVLAEGAVDDVVTCTFVQISFSRDGTSDSDAPLVPWNFYYWPTALRFRNADGTTRPNPLSDQAGDVMERYANAFGKDGGACRLAEKANHGTPAVGAGWEGHCHNSAPASIFFEQPAASTHNGESFDEEEMEYLAAEFFGNFGNMGTDWWELKRGPSKPGGASARWYIPAYFKPGGPKTKAAFVSGLKSEGFTAASGPTSADEIADTYVTAAGGEAAFTTQVEKWMGELAAEFYDRLIAFMRVKKHPLLSNMRSYRGSSGPEEVWNQGFFWYRAFYQENGDTKDEKDILITCDLRANVDTYPSSGLPATISGTDITPLDDKSLIFDHLWRIQFDGSGKIVVSNAKNEWRHLRNSAASGSEELFTSSELLTLGKASTSRKSGDAFSLGNPFVGTDLISSGMLKVHTRYT